MLNRRHMLALIGANALQGSMAFDAFAQTASDRSSLPEGKVNEVKGTARGRKGGELRDLRSGDALFIGESMQTMAASRLSAALGPATKLFMGENTRVTIDKYLVARGGTIHISSGALLFDRKPPDPKAPVTIRSPFAMMAVRGTTVFAGPSNGVFGIFVADGLVVVRNRAGSVTLHAGQGTNIARPGARPTAAVQWSQARIDAALASVR